ncbi:MAG TPA: tripartite transporter, partial [Hyphomicrobiaceae bacterium]|nr:tripartite transporter [Hyphomicrobiaceae bacterium]
MIDWVADNLALIMFVTMFFVIFCGFPVAFVMGGTGLLFAAIGWLLGVFPIASLSNILLRMW